MDLKQPKKQTFSRASELPFKLFNINEQNIITNQSKSLQTNCFQLGKILPPRNIWKYLEIFLIIRTCVWESRGCYWSSRELNICMQNSRVEVRTGDIHLGFTSVQLNLGAEKDYLRSERYKKEKNLDKLCYRLYFPKIVMTIFPIPLTQRQCDSLSGVYVPSP